jgi:hypothetical protein
VAQGQVKAAAMGTAAYRHKADRGCMVGMGRVLASSGQARVTTLIAGALYKCNALTAGLWCGVRERFAGKLPIFLKSASGALSTNLATLRFVVRFLSRLARYAVETRSSLTGKERRRDVPTRVTR